MHCWHIPPFVQFLASQTEILTFKAAELARALSSYEAVAFRGTICLARKLRAFDVRNSLLHEFVQLTTNLMVRLH